MSLALLTILSTEAVQNRYVCIHPAYQAQWIRRPGVHGLRAQKNAALFLRMAKIPLKIKALSQCQIPC